jgi:hypothetical protein
MVADLAQLPVLLDRFEALWSKKRHFEVFEMIADVTKHF